MLLKSQKKNKSLEITGCLLYHNNKFVQLIEGNEIAVKTLYATILEDPRHNNVQLLDSAFSPLRLFRDWSMVFNNLNAKTDQVEDKRLLFDTIYHESDIVSSPGNSKITLWTNVYDILYAEGSLIA